MTKYIPSFELTLNREINSLKAELAQLHAENEHLKTENARLTMQSFGKQPHKIAIPSKKLTVQSPSTSPSYAQPTVASTNRAKKPDVVEDSKVVVDDRSPMYVDGKLVVINKPRPLYMRRTRGRGLWGARGDSMFGPEDQTLWVTNPRPESPTTNTIRWHYDCENCNKLEIAWKDESAHSLAARSRLDDAEHKFQLSGAACVNLPYRKQHQYLQTAFKLAQDVIWHHLRKHCPDTQIQHCFEGPREVAFCRSELLGLIANVERSLKEHNMTYILTSTMVGVTALRNTLAHQNRVSLAYVDVLLTRVQKLAVVCLDEPRAIKLRRLRDTLRTQAEQAVVDISERFLGTWGPDNPERRQWALHQQRTFHDLINFHENKEFRRYKPAPEVVKMAAWEWHAENGHRPLGSLNYEYIDALEKASAGLVESRPMTPPPPEFTAEEIAAYRENYEKQELEKRAIMQAAVEAAEVSDEGEEDVPGQPPMTVW